MEDVGLIVNYRGCWIVRATWVFSKVVLWFQNFGYDF
jgi:hypothetical protein